MQQSAQKQYVVHCHDKGAAALSEAVEEFIGGSGHFSDEQKVDGDVMSVGLWGTDMPHVVYFQQRWCISCGMARHERYMPMAYTVPLCRLPAWTE